MTESRSFLCLEFIVFSWCIGWVISIAQLPSRLGTAFRRFDSRPLPFLSFLLLVLSFFFLLQKTNISLSCKNVIVFQQPKKFWYYIAVVG